MFWLHQPGAWRWARRAKPHCGYGCLTGQGNGQGGREHGQKADQLPGYRKLDNPDHRAYIADVWGVAERDLPRPGRSAYEMLDAMGTDGGVRALLVFGSNIAVSAPRAGHIGKRLDALDFLMVSDFFLSETAELADVVLPSAQWAEEEGTMTNLEGRVILRQRAMEPPAGVRTDIEDAFGACRAPGIRAISSLRGPPRFLRSCGVRRRAASADYSGITWDRIRRSDGVFWPCPTNSIPARRARFSSVSPRRTARRAFIRWRSSTPRRSPTTSFRCI